MIIFFYQNRTRTDFGIVYFEKYDLKSNVLSNITVTNSFSMCL